MNPLCDTENQCWIVDIQENSIFETKHTGTAYTCQYPVGLVNQFTTWVVTISCFWLNESVDICKNHKYTEFVD